MPRVSPTSESARSTHTVGYFRRAVAPRLVGLALTSCCGLLLWLIFRFRSVSIKGLALLVFVGAPGLWLVVFGYPIDSKALAAAGASDPPMAPLWWRIGLTAWLVVWLVAVSAFFSP